MYSIKQLTKLTHKSFRDQEGVFLTEGKKIVEEAVHSKFTVVQLAITNEFAKANDQFLRQLPPAVSVAEVSLSNMQRLSTMKTPPGVIAVIKKPQVTFERIKKHHKLAIFENIKDPGNLGTMLRTADWFGVTGIIVSHTGVDPYNDKVIRATMGSHFHQEIYTSPSLTNDLKELKQHHFQLIVSTLKGKQSSQDQLPIESDSKWALIMGNESLGVSESTEKLATTLYTIPGQGQAESLNVAVSFGIILHDLVK